MANPASQATAAQRRPRPVSRRTTPTVTPTRRNSIDPGSTALTSAKAISISTSTTGIDVPSIGERAELPRDPVDRPNADQPGVLGLRLDRPIILALERVDDAFRPRPGHGRTLSFADERIRPASSNDKACFTHGPRGRRDKGR